MLPVTPTTVLVSRCSDESILISGLRVSRVVNRPLVRRNLSFALRETCSVYRCLKLGRVPRLAFIVALLTVRLWVWVLVRWTLLRVKLSRVI